MSAQTGVDNPLNALIPVIATAVERWREDHSPKQIEAKVTRTLNNKSQEIILKLLGFNNQWDRWELDHCNGRSGNSAAGDYMRKCHQEAIEKWITKMALPVLPKDLNQKLKQSLQAQFNRSLEETLRNKVIAYAQEEATRVFKELEVPSLLDNYMQTLQLIKKE